MMNESFAFRLILPTFVTCRRATDTGRGETDADEIMCEGLMHKGMGTTHQGMCVKALAPET